MTKVTIEQFKNMTPKLGGDLWNQYKLCKIAFAKFPEAKEIKYSIGTGLWVDLTYITKEGQEKTGTIYERDEHV